ncbi:MAG TPA: hypothetical protein VFI49_08120 [Rudaea sp.]|nr:hypothetical protein [Rudaea sp.]
MTQRSQTPIRETLGSFYSSMSRTSKAAANFVSVVTPNNAAALRASLVQTIRTVDQVAAAIAPPIAGEK